MAEKVIAYTVQLRVDLDQLVRDASRITPILRGAVAAAGPVGLGPAAMAAGATTGMGSAAAVSAAAVAAQAPREPLQRAAAAMTTAAVATQRAASTMRAVPAAPPLRAPAPVLLPLPAQARQPLMAPTPPFTPPVQRPPVFVPPPRLPTPAATPPAPRPLLQPALPVAPPVRPPASQPFPGVWRQVVGPATAWPVAMPPPRQIGPAAAWAPTVANLASRVATAGTTAALAGVGTAAQGVGSIMRGSAMLATGAWGMMDRAVQGAGRSIFNLRTALAGLGMFQLGRSVVNTASTFEQLRVQFTLFYGSAIRGQRELAHVIQLAKVTPFNVIELAEAKRLLRAYQVEGERALMAVADTAAATNRPLQQVAMAIGRIRSGVYGEGFELLRRVGVSRQELEKQGLRFSRAGYYEGDPLTAINAVVKSMELRFGGMSQALVKTWKGALSNIKDAWTVAVEPLGTLLISKLTPKIEALTNKIWDASMEMKKGFETSFAEFDISGALSKIVKDASGIEVKIPVKLDITGEQITQAVSEHVKALGSAMFEAEPSSVTGFGTDLARSIVGSAKGTFAAVKSLAGASLKEMPEDAFRRGYRWYHEETAKYATPFEARSKVREVELERDRTLKGLEARGAAPAEIQKRREGFEDVLSIYANRLRELDQAVDKLGKEQEVGAALFKAETLQAESTRHRQLATQVRTGAPIVAQIERGLGARAAEVETANARLIRGNITREERNRIVASGLKSMDEAIRLSDELEAKGSKLNESKRILGRRLIQPDTTPPREGMYRDLWRGPAEMSETFRHAFYPDEKAEGTETRRVMPVLREGGSGIGPASQRRGQLPVTSSATTKPPTEAQVIRQWRNAVRRDAFGRATGSVALSRLGDRRDAFGVDLPENMALPQVNVMGGGGRHARTTLRQVTDNRTYNVFGYWPPSEMAGMAMRDNGYTTGGGFR